MDEGDLVLGSLLYTYDSSTVVMVFKKFASVSELKQISRSGHPNILLFWCQKLLNQIGWNSSIFNQSENTDFIA